ncbi:MAG: hypothetical protein RBT65_16635 [Methanolobus sp.]|nr:hypothetical protein [Methanolobus sp.]
MTTFTLITKAGKTVDVSISEEQSLNFIDGKIKKLQDKLAEYEAMDAMQAGELAVNSLKTKVNKLEADGKLESSYAYEDLKKRSNGVSFTGYLTDMGIEKSLHGSATRALSLGKAALAGLKLAEIDDPAVKRTVAENAVGGKNSLWRDSVIEWLLHSEADAE